MDQSHCWTTKDQGSCLPPHSAPSCDKNWLIMQSNIFLDMFGDIAGEGALISLFLASTSSKQLFPMLCGCKSTFFAYKYFLRLCYLALDVLQLHNDSWLSDWNVLCSFLSDQSDWARRTHNRFDAVPFLKLFKGRSVTNKPLQSHVCGWASWMPGTGRPITILHWLFKRVVLVVAETINIWGVWRPLTLRKFTRYSHGFLCVWEERWYIIIIGAGIIIAVRVHPTNDSCTLNYKQ